MRERELFTALVRTPVAPRSRAANGRGKSYLGPHGLHWTVPHAAPARTDGALQPRDPRARAPSFDLPPRAAGVPVQERVPFDVAVLDAIVSAFKLSENEQREAEERKRRRTVLAPLRPKTPAHHKDARSQQNPRYPKRSEVSDERVPWSTPWDGDIQYDV